jgi:hypothetical protein
MRKDTPESFAKVMLWALADVRAGLDQLLPFAATQIAMMTKTDLKQVKINMEKDQAANRRKIYRRMVVGAGLEEPTQEEMNRPPEIL